MRPPAQACYVAPMTTKTPIGILISGRGSNMVALIEAARDPTFPARVAIVISNRPEAAGLARARELGVKAVAIDHKAYPSREAFDDVVHAALLAEGVEILCCAGFMRLQSAAFVQRWLGRQINIHPSLLPAFKGLRPQQQALDAGVRLSGCTVHFVTEEMDAGPIIAQAAVPVVEGDTPEVLEARILAAEHRLYPASVALVATGRVRMAESRAIVHEAGPPPPPLLWPCP